MVLTLLTENNLLKNSVSKLYHVTEIKWISLKWVIFNIFNKFISFKHNIYQGLCIIEFLPLKLLLLNIPRMLHCLIVNNIKITFFFNTILLTKLKLKFS